MKKSLRLIALSAGLVMGFPGIGPNESLIVADDEIKPSDLKFFETKIRPVLVRSCYSCHSSKTGKTKGGFALDTRAGIRAGGDSGHGVVPGDLEGSLILSALRHESFEMPPKKQLPENVIRNFEIWIKRGAADPRGGKSIVKNKSTIDFVAGREFWAFQQPRMPPTPTVRNKQWPTSEIDQFVLRRLEAAGLAPVEKASPAQLLRRDYINLVGIPPTEEQASQFFSDRSPDKREKLIDGLMKTSQFGERWGRYWLDVARFAESNGRERNFLFPHAWRYRNYVIDSFNQDKPFSRFIQEQIAGDLLKPLKGQPASEPKVATGFLAVGPKLLNERNKEIFAMDMVDEQIDVVSRSTMAMTVSCSRCHDHKFDPVSTEDYYALAGIFRSTQTLFGRAGGGSRQATGLMDIGNSPGLNQQLKAEHEKQIKGLSAQVKRITEQIKSNNKKTGSPKNKKPQSATPRLNAAEIAKLRRKQRNLQQKLKQLQQSGPAAAEVAMGVTEGPCMDCNVLVRGEVTAKGTRVPRGFLTVLGETERPVVASDRSSGRLELAQWITSAANPLTSRVAVNRIWQHLFGEGLVRTVDNFGETGDRPTHPELLDYLAIRFVNQGWSFKKMIREIMLSQTYQLSGQYHEDNYEVDPDNHLLWRMNSRRLDAEVLRDSILFAAGDLDLKPPKTSVVAKYKSTQGIGRGVTEETFNVEMPKRSVYLPVVRNAVPEPLRVFDFAEPSILVGNRQVTTVPTQALYMMNSQFVIEHARNLAKRLLQPGASREEQVKRAYQAVVTRLPTEAEVSRAQTFLELTKQKLVNQKERAAEELAFTAFCQALFASGEFRILN
ncbi:MAG: PSD1 and planctomycete cytochrome C domain-containing protein [Planctomycetota bacterium]|nr:PSD1 and planctomycete cytochrome C domain-containing protein [Planctomycetota bacterium]